MSDWCTKTSLEPSSGAMKPNPFVALNHLTVPTAIVVISFCDPHAIGEVSNPVAHVTGPLGPTRKLTIETSERGALAPTARFTTLRLTWRAPANGPLTKALDYRPSPGVGLVAVRTTPTGPGVTFGIRVAIDVTVFRWIARTATLPSPNRWKGSWGVTTRVVIADDIDDLRWLLRHQLELGGDFRVVGEAANGAQAVEA